MGLILTLQPDETNGIDSRINALYSTYNYPSDGLEFGGYTGVSGLYARSLIKFDLTSISGATILSAKLTLTTSADYANNGSTVRVYRLKRNWIENQVTWNIFSSGNNWQTAGAFGAIDCEQTDIGSLAYSNSIPNNSALEITLDPSKVREMSSGTLENNGFLIKADYEVDSMYVCHGSESATPSYRPKLVIDYLLNSGPSISVSNEIGVAI